jgi:hypothetical protein
VGDAWARTIPLKDLFLEDGSHPSVTGNDLTSRVFFQTFFGL